MALHPCCLPFIFSKFKLDSLARKADSFDSAGDRRSVAHPESRGLRKGSILSGSGIWHKKEMCAEVEQRVEYLSELHHLFVLQFLKT